MRAGVFPLQELIAESEQFFSELSLGVADPDEEPSYEYEGTQTKHSERTSQVPEYNSALHHFFPRARFQASRAISPGVTS